MSTTLNHGSNGVNRGKLVTAGLASVAAAVAANVVALFIIRALIDLPPDFPPLTVGAITFFTIIGTGLGALVFGWPGARPRPSGRIAPRPRWPSSYRSSPTCWRR